MPYCTGGESVASDVAHNWLLYIAAFASAFGISLVTTPLAKKISIKLGGIDYPKDRGLHKEPLPRMGGIAIVLGFMLTMFILLPFIPEMRTMQFAGFIVAALIIVILGMFDDIHNLSSKLKLAVQIVAALIVIYSGTRINVVSWPYFASLEMMSAPITLIWIIGVTNAVNLIDGVDGLAAGVSSIAALCLAFLCVLSGNPMAVFFTTTLAGSCWGFLPRNFSPAELIMGDTGATFLGFALAVSSIIGVYKAYALLAVLISVFAIALPIFDTLFAMLRRALNGRPIMEADRGHLHHRLIDSGLSHKQAVIVMYCISIFCAIISILIAVRDYRAVIVVFVFVLVCFLMTYVYRKRVNDR